jgi:hypothetical protein
MAPGTELGRVAVNGRDQFITRLPGEASTGVEVPRGEIRSRPTAGFRKRDRASPPSAGMRTSRSVSALLQLPPGWRLLHVGRRQASYSWLTRWSLLDLFVVLVVAMAFLRLFGPGWGRSRSRASRSPTPGPARRAGCGSRCWRARLRRAVVRGRLAALVRTLWQIALVWLVLARLPFALVQLRGGLHPALENPGLEAPALEFEPQQPARSWKRTRSRRRQRESAAPKSKALRALGVVSEEREDRSRANAGESYAASSWAPDPKARVTTGPGLPTWSWRTVRCAGADPSSAARRCCCCSPRRG